MRSLHLVSPCVQQQRHARGLVLRQIPHILHKERNAQYRSLPLGEPIPCQSCPIRANPQPTRSLRRGRWQDLPQGLPSHNRLVSLERVIHQVAHQLVSYKRKTTVHQHHHKKHIFPPSRQQGPTCQIIKWSPQGASADTSFLGAVPPVRNVVSAPQAGESPDVVRIDLRNVSCHRAGGAEYICATGAKEGHPQP